MGMMRESAEKVLRALRSPAIGAIRRFSKGEHPRLFITCILYAAGALLSLSVPLVMKDLIDEAVARDLAGVRARAFLLAGLLITMLLIEYARNMLQEKIRIRLTAELRKKVMSCLLGRSYGPLSSYHSGELVSRVLSDAAAVADGITDILPPFLYLSVQLIGAAVILLRMNGYLMLLLIAAGFAGAAASFGMGRRMKILHRDAQQARDRYHAAIQETLGNLLIVKSSGTEKRRTEGDGRLLGEMSGAQMKRTVFSSRMHLTLGGVFRASWFLTLLWGCVGIARGSMTYGSLTAILQLSSQIRAPFEGFISTAACAIGTVSSAERLMELYEIPRDGHGSGAGSVPPRFREITLKGVEFSYDKREKVLRGVDLAIREGDFTAITGLSGSGKSTLFLLLMGIYEPDKGSIRTLLADGQAVGAERELFSYVPQDNALFSGTLRENIAMFREDTPTDGEIREAARLACIDAFIASLDQGLDTRIGEHGLGLSQGQAQRIAVARALLSRAPVLLLDEATSALDEETEARLLGNIASMGNKTCLIVTHRRAALGICGRQVRLENGVLAERANDIC